MKKLLLTTLLVVTFFALTAVSASAVVNGTVKVGLRYGSSVLSSANLENAVGEGYEFGYFDEDRCFEALDWTEETAITMSPREGGGIQVTVTGTDEVLFETEEDTLGVLPQDRSPITWFKGYKYCGGFEYTRSGSGLQVVNVVDLEDYVKGVLPYEMGPGWPSAALEAQAVCARTYVQGHSKHLKDYGFDVCAATCCQVYNGTNGATAVTDDAVDATAGECLYYDGELVMNAVYHSSDGGATEDAVNVWGTEVPYLKGKEDPFEAETNIPNYSWTVTYTAEELTWVLQNSGYNIGTVQDVYISGRTDQGNVSRVTFVDTAGKELTVRGEACRMAFYSNTYGKNVRSMRFEITGGSGEQTSAGGTYYVNGAGTKLSTLAGVSVISGGGTVTTLPAGELYVLTSSGKAVIGGKSSKVTSSKASGIFVITGTGSGYNVGMSQYGAKAMAEQGYTYDEILEFYYTDITIR